MPSTPSRPRKRLVYLRKLPTEEAEQRALAAWLNARRILWMHPPNGGHRAMSEARRLKAMGVSPGVPDILIFDPPPKFLPDWDNWDGPPVGVAIELKRQKGGVLTDEQALWLLSLERRGWMVKMCKGAQQAVDWLQGLGY